MNTRPPARVLAIALAAALLAIPCLRAAASDLSDAQQRLKTVQKRIGAIKAQIEHSRAQRDDIDQGLEKLERRIGKLGAQLHALDDKIQARQRDVNRLTNEQQHKQQALSKQMHALAGQLRAAYRNGRPSKLRLLFTQQDPAALGRMLVYYDYYARAQSKAIADVRQKLHSLRDTRADLLAQQANLRADRKRQSELLGRMRQTHAAREQTLAQIEQRLHGAGEDLNSLKQDKNDLHALIDKLRSQLADIPEPNPGTPFARLKGQLRPPVKGRTIAAFGQPKAGGRLHWNGVWLGAKRGAPVHAAAAGRVVYVGWMHRYGLIVVLDNGDDYYTVYGHAQSVYAKVGSQVRAGEVIAAAGDSGGHKTTGVYFEIRHGRTPVNPARWLKS